MENPATWNRATRIIQDALTEARRQQTEGLIGYSTARIIHDALEREHLLAEGDGWIAAHRVAKALTNLIVACDRAQDWSGGTRVGNAIDEAEEILAELPALPRGKEK